MTDYPSHSDAVQSILRKIVQDSEALLSLWKNEYSAPGTEIYSLDMLAYGAVRRSVSSTKAFVMMVEAWNMTIARTLLRTHIDTALRFSAAWLVNDPHQFARDVMAGKNFSQLKARDKEQLRDAYLVRKRKSEYPWLPKVYEELSGYIHFSMSHITDGMELDDTDEHKLSMLMSETDLKFPDESWIEIIECFRETTGFLAKYLIGYAHTKKLTPIQLEKGRALFLNKKE